MQKVEGSSPFIRFTATPGDGGRCFGRGGPRSEIGWAHLQELPESSTLLGPDGWIASACDGTGTDKELLPSSKEMARRVSSAIP